MQVNYEGCLDILKEIVAIRSVSGEENRLSDYITDKLTEAGFCPQQIPMDDGRRVISCVISRGGKGEPNILLAGHIDTVEAGGGWQQPDPYIPVVRNGCIFGRGTCDMKAGLAIMLAIALEASESRTALKPALSMLFLPDEEAHSKGVMQAIAHGFSADICFMPEPHFNPMINAAPGKMLISVKVHGKAAHGARPQDGINAVTEAGRFLSLLPGLKLTSHKSFGQHEYVPLKIEGGYKKYSLTIPELCEIIISKQLVLGEDKDSVISQLKALSIDQCFMAGFDFEVKEPYYPPYEVEQDNKNMQAFAVAFEEITGYKASFACGSSVSDANCIAGLHGIPSILFGPSGKNLHKADECVDIDSVRKSLAVYRKYIGFGS